MNWSLDKIRRGVDRIAGMDAASLVATMTLILIIFFAEMTWVIIVPITVLAIAGLLFERFRTDPRLWCLMTALLAVSIYWDWYPQENHQYLYVYICLMLFCAFHVDEQQRAELLATSSRWLLGAVMAAAVVWKAVTPDYLSGDFFHHALLTHPALSDMAIAFGDVPADVVATNQAEADWLAINSLSDTPETSVTLEGSERIGVFAAFLTWWTIIVEALLAVLFLWPNRLGGQHRYFFVARHVTLVAFILAVYPLTPVLGFGWALIVLGVANCARRPTRFRPLYIGLFLLLIFAGYVTLL